MPARKYNAETIETYYLEYKRYIAEYNDSGLHHDRLYPTIEGFRGFLGICPNTWDEYSNPKLEDIPDDISAEDKEKIEHRNIEKIHTAETIKKISDEILNGLFMLALNNPKTAAMAIYLSKQKAYGGYTDKQQIESTGNVEISFKLLDSKGKPMQ